MFSTKIMYPWGLEKLKMDAPLEVSSFSRPLELYSQTSTNGQDKNAVPTEKNRCYIIPLPTPPPTTTATQSSRCGEVRPRTKQT